MDEFIRFDRQTDALTSLVIFSDCMEKVTGSQNFWKYAIISIHNALQGYMCISLRAGNSFLTWKENHFKKWMKAFENGGECQYPQLDFFMELYDKLFTDEENIDRSNISWLNNNRNNMIHFNNDFLSMDPNSAYICCKEALEAIKLTQSLSKGLFFYEEDQKTSFNKAVKRAENVLCKHEKST